MQRHLRDQEPRRSRQSGRQRIELIRFGHPCVMPCSLPLRTCAGSRSHSAATSSARTILCETLLRAIANVNSFQPGTNMSAWLFTILRNLFRSEYRKRRREVEDGDGRYAESLKSHPEQPGRIEFEELRAALGQLPPDQ